ncbi:MAG: glycosyltransferase family 2 protein [Endomicrobiales bacterium]|nr:glycosyltransferase family 2 protein [Endomicrobiales bacterium]
MIEITVVIPCLNEEKTISPSIEKAKQGIKNSGLEGEVVVVDNGSTDASIEIAEKSGARIIYEKRKGYGSALRRGVEEAKGEYIIMGDADDTYDFSILDQFVEKLKQGYDLVMGSRFKGKILPGAMTWSHRYIGNPILSGILGIFFGGNISDSHCGLRAFTKTSYNKMGLHTTGMEFASEMVIHSLKKKLRITEIPIVYYARKGESKLQSLPDAWRHMRFMLLYSPNYLFLLPGLIFFAIGFILTIRLFYGSINFAGRPWDIHVMVFSSLLAIVGWQILNIGFSAKIYAHQVGLEGSEFTSKILNMFTLERSLILGVLLFVLGLAFSAYIIVIWALDGFGELAQVKAGLVSLTLVAMGIQTIFAGFLASMLQIKYRK